MGNPEPHPALSFFDDQPSIAWGVSSFTAIVALVITYIFKRRPVAWHISSGLLISWSFIGVSMSVH